MLKLFHPVSIPPIAYFEFHNPYSGSIGEFNYKIMSAGDDIRAVVWYGINCLDCSEIAAEQNFSITSEGYQQMKEWLEEQERIYIAL